MTKKLSYLAFVVLTIFFASCKDNDTIINAIVPEPETRGILILCEGNYNGNNSTITFFSTKDSVKFRDVYGPANNGAKLGDLANSMQIFGNKLYIAVDQSNKIEIIDTATYKSVGRIDLTNPSSPREMYFKDSTSAYVTSFYGGAVAKFNPLTQSVTKVIPVGDNPEGIAAANGKIYIALNGPFPTYGNLVVVMNQNTDIVIDTVKVGLNPRFILKDKAGDLYVVCTGGYPPQDSTGKGGIYKISAATGKVVDSLVIYKNPNKACFVGDNIYIINSDGVQKASFISHTVTTAPVIAGMKVNAIYGVVYSINYDSENGLLYLGNCKNYSQDGEIAVFTLNGTEKYRIATGINPNTVLFKK